MRIKRPRLSRHELPLAGNRLLVVGYDATLTTFFGQVFQVTSSQAGPTDLLDLVLWAGSGVEPPPRLSTVDELVAALGDYGSRVDDQLRALLEDDLWMCS